MVSKKEQELHNVVLSTIQNRHFSTDDSIIISSNTTKAKVDDVNFNYKEHMKKGTEITRFCKYDSRLYLPGTTDPKEAERRGYYPIYEYKTCLDWNNYFVRDHDKLEIRIHSLYVDLFQSRYYKVNQHLIELFKRGFFINNSEKDFDTQDFAKYTRNKLSRSKQVEKEFMRQGKLVKELVPEYDWNVKSYDWNMVISDPDFAQRLHQRLKDADYDFEQPYADPKTNDGVYNSVYIKGYYGKTKSILIRCYDTFHTSTPGVHQLKLEISFRKEWLRGASSTRPNLRKVSYFTEQSEIQQLLYKAIRTELRVIFRKAGYLLDKKPNKELDNELKQFFRVKNKDHILDKILEPQFCLSEIITRLEKTHTAEQIKAYKDHISNNRLLYGSSLKDAVESSRKPIIEARYHSIERLVEYQNDGYEINWYKNPDYPTPKEEQLRERIEKGYTVDALGVRHYYPESKEMEREYFKGINPPITEEVDNSLDAFF